MTNRSKTSKFGLALLVTVLGSAAVVYAAGLLGVQIAYPKMTYGLGTTTYSADSYQLAVDATPSQIRFASNQGPQNIGATGSSSAASLKIRINADGNGNILIPATATDLVITGTASDGVTIYGSPLLTGQIVEFGYLDTGSGSAPDNLDFRFKVTGGSLQPFYAGKDIGVTLVVEYSSFAGTFTQSWAGGAKGYAGPIPYCAGSVGDFVWNDLNKNGAQDGNEPGLDQVPVTLTGSDSAGNAVSMTTSTGLGPANQHGYYQFAGLCSGSYSIQATPPPGFLPTILSQGTPATDSNPNPSTIVVLTDNASDQTIDFGFVKQCNGSIGNFVWNDANHNGIQDYGEQGIDKVTLFLKDINGTALNTAITNPNGLYQFSSVCAGNYTVEVDSSTIPPGLSATTTKASGSSSENDNNGSPASVMLVSDNAADNTIDFGYTTPCSGTIGDLVWHDLNRNGIQETGEPGIDGVTVTLFNSDGTTKLRTTTTAGGGFYQFSGLCAGSYTVDVPGSLPLNLTLTQSTGQGSSPANDSNPEPATLMLAGDNSVDTTIDFGYVTHCEDTIGDFVWNDANHNGIQDANEPGLDVVVVNLRNQDNTLLRTTSTDASGFYQFTGLCAGSYKVEVIPPAGFVPTIFNAQGSTTANDSNLNPSTVTLATDTGDSDLTIDFGLYQPIIDSCVNISAIQGVPITPVRMEASGGAGAPYKFEATGLPAGLSMAINGTISGLPTVSGTFTYRVTITDKAGNTGTSDCSVNVLPPLIANCAIINAVQGVAITPVTIVAGGGAGASYRFTATGLPNGLTMSSDGTISGVPAITGTFEYTVTITDSAGNQGTSNCTVAVYSLVTIQCAAGGIGEVGLPFNTGISATGGAPPYRFAIATGTLPAGVTLSPATGLISGTPTAAGSFTVKVTDSLGVVAAGTCPIAIYPPVTVQCAGAGSSQVGVPVNMQVSAVNGLQPYTFAVATGTLPAGLTMNPATGLISGTPTESGSFTVKVTDSLVALTAGTCPITISCVATIGDFVWYDSNLNGVQDAGEPGAPDVTVYLLDASGSTFLQTTSTDGNGHYLFDNLACGTYKVAIGIPSGYTLTTTNVSNTAASDSNPNPSTVSVHSGDSDLSIDFGLVHFQNECTTVCTASPAGVLYWNVEPPSASFINGRLFVRYQQDAYINDNSYGTSGVGWGTKTHSFSDLINSDKAEFIFTQTGGTKVLDFFLDYIHAKSGTPSGYASLGPTGGDGSMVTGDLAWVLSWDTSIAKNLNSTGYCVSGNCTVQGVNLLVDSPPTASSDSFTLTDAAHFGQWNFINSYEVVIDGAAFGGIANFSGVSVGLIHNSPSKSSCTQGAITPTPCTAGGQLALSCAANSGVVNQAYSSSLLATGGTSPYAFSIISSGLLPPGLTLNATSGAITGTPTAGGTYPYTAKTIDSSGNPITNSITSSCSITIATAAPCRVSVGTIKFDRNTIKITILNSGTSTATIDTLLFGKWPKADGKLKNVKNGKDVVWDGSDIPAPGPATLTGLKHNTAPAGGSDEFTFEFEHDLGKTTRGDYQLTLQFAGGCSVAALP